MDLCMSVAAQLMLDQIKNGSSTSKNVILSPMSIVIVLTMLASGSNGETLDQFLRCLGVKDIEELTANARAMMSLIASAAEDDDDDAISGGGEEGHARPVAPPSVSLRLGKRPRLDENETLPFEKNAPSQKLPKEPVFPMADGRYPFKPAETPFLASSPSVPRFDIRPSPFSVEREQRLREEPVFPMADRRYPLNPAEIPFPAPWPSVPRLEIRPSPFSTEREQRLREEPVFRMADRRYLLNPHTAGIPLLPSRPSIPRHDMNPWLVQNHNQTSPFAAEREQRRREEPFFSTVNSLWADHDRYPMSHLIPHGRGWARPAALPFLPGLGNRPWQFEDSKLLPSVAEEKEQQIRQEPVFSMANALWVDHRYPLKPRFAEIADTVYKSLVKNVDLVNEAEKVRKEVNSWAEKETKGLIKEVLFPGTKLTPPLCLANALYFEAPWQTPFSLSDTLHGKKFYLLNGETVEVSFMTTHNKRFFFGSFKDFKLLRLPYKRAKCYAENESFSMYIFLPHARDGLRDLIAKLDADPAALHLNNFHLMDESLSRVWIPKLKFSFSFEAQDLIKAKGLTLPFDPICADFSDMVERRENVFVRQIIHKAIVEVAENGTKAAAVTVCA